MIPPLARQKRRVARLPIGELLDRRAVEVFEPFTGEHGAHGDFGDALARARAIPAYTGGQRVVTATLAGTRWS